MKDFLKKYYPQLLIALSVLILIYRAFMGFCFSDETFYYSISYRLLSGDAPFFEEWYPTQLNSILLLPIVALYKAFFGSKGVILFFRILYVVVNALCSLFLYKVIKFRHQKLTATICSLLFLFYAHLSIATFSYYAVSVLSSVMLCSCLLHYYELYISGIDHKKYLVYSGIFTATFVLSMPTMAVAYIITAVIILLLCLYKKVKPNTKLSYIASFNQKKVITGMLYNLYGILIIAVPFFIYLFSSVKISDFINSIPYVLTDEEHITTTLYVTFLTFVRNVTDTFTPFFYIVCLFMVAAAFIRLLRYLINSGKLPDKLNKIISHAEAVLVALDFVTIVVMAVKTFAYTGYVQSIMIIGVVPILILTNRPAHRIIVTFLYVGILMAFGYTYTSTGSPLYTEAIGFFVMGIGAACLFEEYAMLIIKRAENRNIIPKVATATLYLLLSIILFMTMFQRMNTVYRDDKISNLNVRITQGPGAGIMTTAKHLESYNALVDTINNYCQIECYDDNSHNNLLVSKLAPFSYIISDMKCAACCSWRSQMDSERLPLYYSVHPDRFPDVVLILNDDIGSYETSWDILGDPTPNSNVLSGDLYDYISSNYQQKSVPCGTLYIK